MFRRLWLRIGRYYGWLKPVWGEREITKEQWEENRDWIENQPFKSVYVYNREMSQEETRILDNILPRKNIKYKIPKKRKNG